MVFLRPTLMRDSEGADPLTDRQYERIQGVQRKAAPRFNLVLPDMESPSLPPRKLQVPASDEAMIPADTGSGVTGWLKNLFRPLQ